MIDYSVVLSTYYVGSQWSLNGDAYEGLTWYSETPKPSQQELDEKYEQWKKEYLYKIQRAQEYPSLHDISIALWEKVVEGDSKASDELQTIRIAIKEKYPSPGIL